MIHWIHKSQNGGRRKSKIFTAIVPDFGGFTVKADSEVALAHLLMAALQPMLQHACPRAEAARRHSLLPGICYDHNLDWRNPKNDRARAAYDIFQPLDGKFDENVIIQIKHGPIDFQAREPVSPLFADSRRLVVRSNCR